MDKNEDLDSASPETSESTAEGLTEKDKPTSPESSESVVKSTEKDKPTALESSESVAKSITKQDESTSRESSENTVENAVEEGESLENPIGKEDSSTGPLENFVENTSTQDVFIDAPQQNKQEDADTQANQADENLSVGTLPEMTSEAFVQAMHAGGRIEGVQVSFVALDLVEAKPQFKEKVVITDARIKGISWKNSTFHNVVVFHSVCFEEKVDFQDAVMFLDRVHFTNCKFLKGVNFSDITRPQRYAFMDCEIESIQVKDCLMQNFMCHESKVAQRLIVKDTKIQENVKFDESQIREISWQRTECGQFSAKNLRVKQECKVKASVFSEDFCITGIKCSARFHIESCQFVGSFDARQSDFGDRCIFKDCSFQANSLWNNSRFGAPANFSKSKVQEMLCFDGADFFHEASLDEMVLGETSLRGTAFHKTVSFQKSKIHGEFLWYDAICNDEANFNFAEFGGRVSFGGVQFLNGVTFYRSTFKEHAWFLSTDFQDASFVNTTFEGQAFFSFDNNTLRERNRRRQGKNEKSLQFVSVFRGSANFTNTLFYRKTVFENVFFEGFANFESACFAEEINFEKAHFRLGATFKSSFCTQELNFTKAVFDDYVNFDLANINRRLNLADTSFDKGISFYHAVIDVVVVEKDQIENRLVYEGTVPGREDMIHLMRVKEEYLIMKESFHQRGKFDEEDWSYYRYRVNDRKSITSKAWNSLTGEPILTVQDDVPGEEKNEPDVIVEEYQGNLNKYQKKLSSLEKKLDRQKAGSQQHRDIQQKVKRAERNQQQSVRRLEQAKRVKTLEESRMERLHESRDKPFSTFDAICKLLSNILWFLVDIGTGYGVKPFRIAFLAGGTIFIFAMIYMFVSPGSYPNLAAHTTSTKQFFNWVYFSAMTFATSSPEGDIAYNDQLKFFIMTEALLGVFFMALFVACYTRKILR